MAVQKELVTDGALRRIGLQPPPDPPAWRGTYRIAAWLPTGEFHRLFPAVLVYDRPGERRYFIPAGSRVWNRTRKGWTSWVAPSGSYKRFLDGRWWNETLNCDNSLGRYYDIASPPVFGTGGVSYVDLYLDVEKRPGRTLVVDRNEWNAFRATHPLSPDIVPSVEFAMREARRFGPASWRAALDRMEGECRRWLRDVVRDELTALGVIPSAQPVPSASLAILVERLERRLGARLSRRDLAAIPSASLGRAVFDAVTAPSAARRLGGPTAPRAPVKGPVPVPAASRPRAPGR